MSTLRVGCLLFVLGWSSGALAQVPQVEPQIVTHAELEGRVTVVEIAAHFVTTIRVPEVVNSVVVGDPAKFQVEHSEREPRLVFIKALTTKPVQTNLLISTATGHQTSLLLVSRGEGTNSERVKVDFLVKYEPSAGFLVEPAGYPFAMVGETISLAQAAVDRGSANGTPLGAVAGARLAPVTDTGSRRTDGAAPGVDTKSDELDQLLERQQRAPLPLLYGERVTEEKIGGDPIRAGVSEVIDGGQRVIVLFSVVNHEARRPVDAAAGSTRREDEVREIDQTLAVVHGGSVGRPGFSADQAAFGAWPASGRRGAVRAASLQAVE
jgi:hypothetical protein